MSATALVTGGSGFIASHVILQLVAAGLRVRTTLRSAARVPALRAALAAGGLRDEGAVDVFLADLLRDDGWREAAQGCDYVLHVASPVPPSVPRDENELVVPARDGTVRVLRAARDAGVRRVVLTSSFAAMGYGHEPRDAPFDEDDWTRIGAATAPYPKSKTLAERAAWDFIASAGGALELATVNPVAVFGPVLDDDYSSSVSIVQRMLAGRVPFVPRMWLGGVDVRDVADLHLRAMVHPAARGERFLATAGDFVSMRELALALRAGLGHRARRAPRLEMPDAAIRALALLHPVARGVLPELGKRKNATSGKARRILGWAPRSLQDALVACGESLIARGLVPGA